ncbi:MAG: pyridoxamine 5'-phosphate oxidase family protein [Halobacteriota archaeon]
MVADEQLTSDDFAAVQGIEMSDVDADELLQTKGFGVLSLAADGEAYGIPVSFGYDGERLFFVFLRPAETSKKERFVDETERASFLVYDVTSAHDWRSVVVSGPIRRLDDDEWDELVAALEDNAWFPSLFSQTEPMRAMIGLTLLVEDVSGQQSHSA